jgi:hypothetical protein
MFKENRNTFELGKLLNKIHPMIMKRKTRNGDDGMFRSVDTKLKYVTKSDTLNMFNFMDKDLKSK